MSGLSFSFIREPPPEEEAGPKKVYGVVTGRVVSVADPLFLGRVQVQLPFLDSTDPSPWARVAVPLAGPPLTPPHGSYFLPSEGTEVLVVFEQGDVNSPYVLGCLWGATAPPPLPSPAPGVRALRTLAGNQIVFADEPPTLTLQSGPTPPEAIPSPPASAPPGAHQTVVLSPAGVQVVSPATITLQVGDSSLALTPAGITLQSKGNRIALTPTGMTISGPTITISGSTVDINPPTPPV